MVAAAISGAVGLAGAAMSASAAKKAAAAQENAAKESIQFQRDVVSQSRIDAYPWALEGAKAMYMYMDELGIPRPKTQILPDLTQGPFGVGGGTAQQASAGGGGSTAQQAAAQPQQAAAAQPRQPFVGQDMGQWLDQGVRQNTSDPNNEAQYSRGYGMAPRYQAPAPANAAPSPYKSPDQIPMTAQKGFTATPSYQFRVNEGQKGVLNSLAALGMKNSGRALKALDSFSQGIASEEYNGWLNRIAGVAGMGQSQTNTNNAQMQQAGGNIGATMQDAGQARASGYVGAANAWSQGFNQVGNAIGQLSGSRGGGMTGLY